ncbi:MAG: hypothetical protein WC939_04600, partial [Acholeplasmataceae bacterium]
LGVRQDVEFEGEKEVSFTLTFTYQEITKTKIVKFNIMGVYIFDNIESMLYGDNKAKKGDVVKLNNVAYYTDTEDGYYIIDSQGHLLFQYGTTNKPAANKVFNVKFELDIYYGSPQIKTPTFEEVTGTPVEPNITEITLQDLVQKPTPSEAAPLLHRLYKVSGAKLHVFAAGTEKYKTFLVPQTHTDPTKEPNKSDSMMLYYQTPGGLALLQGLVDGEKAYSKNFEHIVIVVSAFRTNNDIYAFMFLGDIDDEADLELSLTNADKAEQALRNAANKIESQILLEGQDYTLTASETFDGHNYSVTYTSGNPTVVGHDGKVVAGQFPAPGTIIEIEFTLTTNSIDDVEVTYKRTVKLGRDASISIDAAVAKQENDVVFFEAYYVTGINHTHQFIDGTSQQGAAVRFAQSVDTSGLEYGKQYLIHATKAADYNGLRQFNGLTIIEMSGTDPMNPTPYDGDFTPTNFGTVMNAWISVEGLEVSVAPSKDSYGVLTYTLKNVSNNALMAFREHQTNTEIIAAIEALNLSVGDRVNLVSGIVSWYNAPQFINGVLEKATLSPEQLFQESVNRFKLTLPALDSIQNENFNLAITFEELDIVWTVTEGSEAAAVDAAGLVTITKGDTPVTVKLSGAITQGEHSATVEVQVIIPKEGAEPEETLHTTIDFGTDAKTGYAAGTLDFVNGDGTAYSLNKDRVQTNTSTFVPHADNGPIMVLSVRGDAKTAFVEFDFTTLTGLSKLSFEFSVWNQNNFSRIVNAEGAELSLEKKVDDSWVKVASADNETNVLSSLVVDVYTTVTFDNLTSGLYRLVYTDPTASGTGNTTTAVTTDNIKVYVTQ